MDSFKRHFFFLQNIQKQVVYLKITPHCALTSWNPPSVFCLLFFYHPETFILGKGLPQERGGDAQQKIGFTTC